MTPKPKRRRGRPAGAKTAPPKTVDVIRERCPHCGSTKREKLQNTKRLEYAGRLACGTIYNEVVISRTHCAACSKPYMVREYR